MRDSDSERDRETVKGAWGHGGQRDERCVVITVPPRLVSIQMVITRTLSVHLHCMCAYFMNWHQWLSLSRCKTVVLLFDTVLGLTREVQ